MNTNACTAFDAIHRLFPMLKPGQLQELTPNIFVISNSDGEGGTMHLTVTPTKELDGYNIQMTWGGETE